MPFSYTSWYLLIIASLLYFLLYNADNFKKLQTYIIVTQIIAMAVYIIFPNRQDLRPEVFPPDKCSDATDRIYLLRGYQHRSLSVPSCGL